MMSAISEDTYGLCGNGVYIFNLLFHETEKIRKIEIMKLLSLHTRSCIVCSSVFKHSLSIINNIGKDNIEKDWDLEEGSVRWLTKIFTK